jgi:hypothetical protein
MPRFRGVPGPNHGGHFFADSAKPPSETIAGWLIDTCRKARLLLLPPTPLRTDIVSGATYLRHHPRTTRGDGRQEKRPQPWGQAEAVLIRTPDGGGLSSRVFPALDTAKHRRIQSSYL